MKRLLLALFFLATFSPFAAAAERIKDLVLRPGETVYARFEIDGKKVKLVGISQEPDAGAQVVFSAQPDTEKKTIKLKVENNLPKDLFYKVVISAKSLNLRSPAQVTPVVAGKVAYETFPGAVEEISAFDFKFAR
jgi:hypothetical protein